MALPGMLIGSAIWGSTAYYGGKELFGLKAGTALLYGATAGGALLGMGGGSDSGWGTGARVGSALGVVGGVAGYGLMNQSALTKAYNRGGNAYVGRRRDFFVDQARQAGREVVEEQIAFAGRGWTEAAETFAEHNPLASGLHPGYDDLIEQEIDETIAAGKTKLGELDKSLKPTGRAGKAIKANVMAMEKSAIRKAAQRELWSHVAQPTFYKGALKWAGAAGLAGLAVGGVIGGMAGHKRTVTSNQPMY